MNWSRSAPAARHDLNPPPPHVDLHSHSTFSDGEDAPADLARTASRLGLSALALTDHDTLAGLPAFIAAADGFEAVGGVEISARRDRTEIHVLGHFVEPGHPALETPLKGYRRARHDRIAAMCERLRAEGLEVGEADLPAPAEGVSVGRPHLAAALVDRGYVPDVQTAFRLYLRRGKPGYVPRPAPEVAEAVAWIHEAGGAASLAHPGTLRRNGWIAAFAADGLDGLEVWHPRHAAVHRRTYLRLARELDLVPVGGSDYHGPRVGDAVVGQEPVPERSLERLRERRGGARPAR